MADVIQLKNRTGVVPETLIVRAPLEFRRPEWQSLDFIQMLRPHAEELERRRREAAEHKGSAVSGLPPHFTLRGGTTATVRGLFVYREDEARMREVYYLAGLVDCMINQVNPVLRTDIIRDLYRRVMDLKERLGLNWYGPIDQVLLPLEPRFYNPAEYRLALASAGSLKALYQCIREGTDEMFGILSCEYVFYTPGRRP